LKLMFWIVETSTTADGDPSSFKFRAAAARVE
jgi:hypothetical protein